MCVVGFRITETGGGESLPEMCEDGEDGCGLTAR